MKNSLNNSINNRIKYLIKLLAGDHSSKFARSISIDPGQLNNYTGKRQSQPGCDVLAKICHVYPHLNERWLLLGHGDVFKSAAPNTSSVNHNENSAQWQLQANNSEIDKSFHHNEDAFKTAVPENNIKTEVEVLKKEVESLRRELDSKEEIIWSKEEIIRSKEEIIQAKDEVITHLKQGV